MTRSPSSARLTPHHQRFIWTFCLVGFFAIFSTTISKNPVLPLFISTLGGGESIIGLIAAVSPLAGIFFSIPAGILFDRYGSRHLLLIAGIVFAAAPLLYLIVSEPLLLIPIRFFHGTATAILGPVIASLIAREYTDTKGAKLGQYSSATLAGRAIAPVIGGAVLTAYAAAPNIFAYHAVYLVAASAGIITLIGIILINKTLSPSALEATSSVTSPSSAITGIRHFFSNIRMSAAAFSELAIYAAFGIFETFLPLYMLACGINALEIGVVLAVQVLIIACTKPIFGGHADTTDPTKLVIAGLFLTLLSCLMVSYYSTFFWFALVNIILGLGVSLTTIATSTYIASLSLEAHLGTSMGTLSTIMDIGHAGGPLLGGILIGIYGYHTGFYASAVILFAGILCLIFAQMKNQ